MLCERNVMHSWRKRSSGRSGVPAISQTMVRQMPPGATRPLVIRYSASNVPILQAALESETLSEQELFDYATNSVRERSESFRGECSTPWLRVPPARSIRPAAP